MSWKPEVLVSGKWSCNALVFATREEAEQNAADLLMRWFVPTDSRAVESNEPVNYSYIDRQLKTVPGRRQNRQATMLYRGYNAAAVDKEIAKDPGIGAAKAKAIHRLLKGRH